MDSKKPLYKSIPFWIMVLFLLYSALGFLAVPYFLKKQLTTIVKTELNSDLSVNNISFNPYTVAVKLTDIKLTDADETIWFSANNVVGNLDFWHSLFSHISLSEIKIDTPSYKFLLERNKENTRLKYPVLKESSENLNSTPLQLAVDNFNINKGLIEYSDSDGGKTLNLNIKEIHFKQDAFTTSDSDTPFKLSFTTENNDNTEISGSFNYLRSSFTTQWRLNHWSTATILSFINDEDGTFLDLSNRSGNVDAHGTVDYSGDPKQLPNVAIENFTLTNFNHAEQSDGAFDLLIPQLIINNSVLDLNNNKLTVENVATNDFQINLTIDKNNELLWKPDFNENSSSEPTQSNSPKSPWYFQINQLQVLNSDLQIKKQSTLESNTTNNFHIENLDITNLSNLENEKLDLTMNASIDTSGQLKINSQIQLHPMLLIADTNVIDLDISKWQAWVPENINLTLAQGKASFNQKITVNGSQYNSQGNIKLDEISFLDNVNQEFLSIEQLKIDQNNIDSKTKNIRLDTVYLNHAQGNLLISEDKELNINTLISTEEKTVDGKKSWTVEIKKIDLQDLGTQVIDKSINPNYHSQLSQVNGSIKGLSSQNLSKADVKLSGVLDTYGKLSIEGQINPLSNDVYTDLKILVNNMDMQNFSSYSSLFLGFPIERGKADFEFQYKLNQSLLKGINDLTFNQLKFGSATPNPDAVNLPLKLAVSLLTDGKGVMKINLPVSGNINDPSFSYGGLVFKAFFKLVTGIVTSPFKLLGKLVPGGADLDLSGIQFKAGAAVLTNGEAAKLKAMQQILKQRPDINLELTPVINTTTDKKEMQIQQLFTKLNSIRTADFDKISQFNKIKKLYITTFNLEQWDQLEIKSTIDKQLNKQQLVELAWQQLTASQNVNEELTLLSKDRVNTIQKQLIEEHNIPAKRLFLKPMEQTETLYPQIKFGIVAL